MKTAVAVRHIHFEDLGVMAPVLREYGYTLEYVDAVTEDLAAYDLLMPDLLVVLGGPVGVYDEQMYPFLRAEVVALRSRLAARRPTLGICLGAQLMAHALGARVYPLGVKEIGFAPLTLTADGGQSALAAVGRTPVLHWHGDQFDIPPGARPLAETAVGKNQAFALGGYALGLQFHLEADLSLFERWLVGHACELSAAGVAPAALRAQAQMNRQTLARVADEVFSAWLQALEGEVND